MKPIDQTPPDEAIYVFIDPDGSLPEPFLAVLVQRRTGVVYGTQCAGVGCQERWEEGFLVPVGGKNADGSFATEDELRQVFHEGASCFHDLLGRAIPTDRLDQLRHLVSKIPFWGTGPNTQEEFTPLQLDDERRDEIAEAWVPVVTPFGPGVLLWTNCD